MAALITFNLWYIWFLVAEIVSRGLAATNCSAPVPGGHTSYNGTSLSIYYPGDILYYSCDTGYKVNSSSPKIRCLATGEWDQQNVACALDSVSVIIAVAVAVFGLLLFIALVVLIVKRPCLRKDPSSTSSGVVLRQRNPRLRENTSANGTGDNRVSLYDSVVLDDDQLIRGKLRIDHVNQLGHYDRVRVVGQTIEEVNENEAKVGVNLQQGVGRGHYDVLKRGHARPGRPHGEGGMDNPYDIIKAGRPPLEDGGCGPENSAVCSPVAVDSANKAHQPSAVTGHREQGVTKNTDEHPASAEESAKSGQSNPKENDVSQIKTQTTIGTAAGTSKPSAQGIIATRTETSGNTTGTDGRGKDDSDPKERHAFENSGYQHERKHGYENTPKPKPQR